jgi:hypothetical protein
MEEPFFMASSDRRHRKVDELPAELVTEVQRLILDGQATYEDIARFLHEHGHTISRSSIGRYSRHIVQRRDALSATVATAKELALITDTASLEELASTLALDKIIDVLMTHDHVVADELGIAEITNIMRALASLQSASIARQKWHSDVADRARRAADDVAKAAERGGLSDEAVQIIRSRILGVAEHD